MTAETDVRQASPRDEDTSIEAIETRWAHSLDEVAKKWIGRMACYHCGGVPCTKEHDQEIRLVDLSFVREVVQHKRELETKYDQYDEEIRKIKEKEESWRVERLLLQRQIQDLQNEYDKKLMRQVEEKLQAEKKWNEEKQRLKDQIKEMEKINKEREKEIEILRKNERKLQMLNLKLDATLEEVENLKQDNLRQREVNHKQQEEIERLKQSRERLTDQLAEATQKIRQLEKKIAQLDTDMNDLLNDTTKEDAIDTLQRKLTKLSREKSDWTSREDEYKTIIAKLTSRIKHVEGNLEAKETECQHMHGEIEALLREIDRLKRQLGGDRSFKNFVSLKREILNIKEENETLKTVIKPAPLPVLKEVKSRPKSAKGDRPKSSASDSKLKRSQISNTDKLHL